MANALGEAAFSGPQDFGKMFLVALANFAQQFGGLLIATGLGEIALRSGNPALMIAGGAALIAAGAAIRALAKPSISGGSGEGSNFSTFNRASVSGNTQNQEITLRAKGSDLVAVFKLAGQDNGSRRS